MFEENRINGDDCLVYHVSVENTLQNFQLGMLMTNRHLQAVPFNCQYVDGCESLILHIHNLVPVSTLLESGKGPSLDCIMQKLGSCIKQLLAYQLMPENMLLDERYIYLDQSYEKLYLIYLPIKSGCGDPKVKLSNLLIQWMDAHMHKQSQQGQQLYLQLLLKLRQESTGFRTLVDLLCKEDWEINTAQKIEPLRYEEQQTVVHESHNAPLSSVPNKALKKTNEKHKSLASKQNTQSIEQIGRQYGIVIIGVVASAVTALLAPLELSSKLGLAMVVLAITLLIHQKFKPSERVSKESKKGAQNKKESTSSSVLNEQVMTNSQSELTDSPLNTMAQKNEQTNDKYSERHMRTFSEDTVLLGGEQPKAVLIIRADEGPKYYSINKEIVTIGRNASVCDLILDETGVGRIHAEVHNSQGGFYIKDAQSLNGTYVNGKRITSNQYFQLKSGDLIKIGHREVVFT